MTAVTPLFGIFAFMPSAQLERNGRFKAMALIGTASSDAVFAFFLYMSHLNRMMGTSLADFWPIYAKHAPQDAIRYLLSPGLRRHPSGLEADCPGTLDCLEHVTAP
jgi:hypothetical protein